MMHISACDFIDVILIHLYASVCDRQEENVQTSRYRTEKICIKK